MRLTRRGWIVLVVAIATLVVGFTWFMSGKNVVCDWRGGYEPCSVENVLDSETPMR